MSLETILERIFNEIDVSKEDILQQAKNEARNILNEAKSEAEGIYSQILKKEKALAEKDRQKQLVNARIQARKNLLKTKQEFIDLVFHKLKADLKKDHFKKQEIHFDKVQQVNEDIDFFLNNIRADYETGIAKILFE